MSSPAPPARVLLPAPPSTKSLPAPPFRVSFPVPPISQSLPPPPLSASLPAPPTKMSSPDPPVAVIVSTWFKPKAMIVSLLSMNETEFTPEVPIQSLTPVEVD
ncbi:hypothetical protein CO676_21720 [Sinorhizobium sp. BJ1]|nr:hypothetical protein CO676_21720 [Sinorhizobium sp. BJ1]